MPDIDDLPEAYREARRRDEPFWEEQERVIQGSLGQPCCTLSGISSNLIAMPGDFAVVVHGEDECAACFRHIGPSAANFYCTGLTERELVTGETAAPLDRCLRLVAEQVAPDAIFVLGACPVEVIGDRFEKVVERVQADFPDVPMVPMHTSGLKVGSQAAMLDWMFSSLASLPTVPPTDPSWRRSVARAGLALVAEASGSGLPEVEAVRALRGPPALDPTRCLNLIGTPEDRPRGGGPSEPVRLLHEAGLTVVSQYPFAASFDDWRAIRFARASFVADRSLYPKLVRILEDGGQDVVDVPLPTGLRQSAEVYAAIGERLGAADAVAAAIAPAREQAERRVEAFRERFRGLRVALGLRMLNNYEADQLAYQGLGDAAAFAELGFDLTILVQGPPDKRDRFERMFERRGIDTPFEMFPEPWTLSEYIGGGRFDVACLADHCRTEARKAGVPMIVSRSLEPWFEGVGRNLDHLERMLGDKLST